VTVASNTLQALNTRWHRPALLTFGVIVLAHWAEHLVQAFQIWGMGWSRPEARGLLGMPFPWLIQSEWLHYGYALVMLAGFFVLRRGFTGRARKWWTAALVIQFWHHIEHLLLLLQALTGQHLLGKPVPTSIAQLVFARVELHLFYNAVVFLPMVVAMYLHLRPTPEERMAAACNCGGSKQRIPATV
jgi:hypothetical protein